MLFVLCVTPGGVLSSSAGSTVSSAYSLFLRKDLINGYGVTQRVCNHPNNWVLAPFHFLHSKLVFRFARVLICSVQSIICLSTINGSRVSRGPVSVRWDGRGGAGVCGGQSGCSPEQKRDYLSVSWPCVWGQEEALGRERALHPEFVLVFTATGEQLE